MCRSGSICADRRNSGACFATRDIYAILAADGIVRFIPLVVAALVGWSSAVETAIGAECTCRFRGKDYVQGSVVCLRTANGSQLAQCSTYLNNTSWKFLQQGCPVGMLPGTVKKAAPASPPKKNQDLENAG